MNFWSFQMNQPQNRGGVKVDSKILLEMNLIGTGDWEGHQCNNFKNVMEIGDILLVHEGKTPIALCEIRSEYFKSEELRQKHIHRNYRTVKVLEYAGSSKPPFPQVQGTLMKMVNTKTDSHKYIQEWLNEIKME